MATVTHLGTTYDCSTAIKGTNYVHLVDSSGVLVAAFDGVSDFSGFSISGGEWSVPTPESECYLAVVKDDGTIGKGPRRCCDITVSSTSRITLSKSAWSNKQLDVTISGVTADNSVIITADVTYDEIWGDANIRVVKQATNSLTFACTDVPTGDVVANILIIG